MYTSTYYVPGTVPGTRDATGNKRVYFLVITNKQTVNKPTSKYMVCQTVISVKEEKKKQDVRE